jgi:hypothetical protein
MFYWFDSFIWCGVLFYAMAPRAATLWLAPSVPLAPRDDIGRPRAIRCRRRVSTAPVGSFMGLAHLLNKLYGV